MKLVDLPFLPLGPVISGLLGATNSALTRFTMTGSYLGPYTVKAVLHRWIPRLIGPPRELPPVWIKFSIDPDKIKEARKGLKEFNAASYHLGWQAQSSFVNKLVNEVTYPRRWNTGDPIVVTHLYSPAADNFMSKVFNQIRHTVLPEMFKDYVLGNGIAIIPGAFKLANTIVFEARDELDDMYNTLSDLDQEWSNDGDAVVESFSQKGINIESGFNPDLDDRDFDVVPFSLPDGTPNRHITHNLGMAAMHPDFSAEAHQGFGISRELGVSPLSRQSIFNASGSVARSSLHTNASGDTIAVKFANASTDTLHGFTAEYFVTADSTLSPSLRILNSGGLSLSLIKITVV
jgi:hypothetical protein